MWSRIILRYLLSGRHTRCANMHFHYSSDRSLHACRYLYAQLPRIDRGKRENRYDYLLWIMDHFANEQSWKIFAEKHENNHVEIITTMLPNCCWILSCEAGNFYRGIFHNHCVLNDCNYYYNIFCYR